MSQRPTRLTKLYRQNIQSARRKGVRLSPSDTTSLRELTTRLKLSVAAGELIFLGGGWYVTHTGLLRIALRRRCAGIDVRLVGSLSDAHNMRWVAKATVYRSLTCKGFAGYGDADPYNVSPVVRGAEMRVAETRAVNRALRKDYGIGICSVEELGSPRTTGAAPEPTHNNQQYRNQNGSNNGQPRLRDQLLLLIRDHK